MFRRLNKWLCKQFGHKEGWYPAPPWRCERCGEDFKPEWDRDYSERYYNRFEALAREDKERAAD